MVCCWGFVAMMVSLLIGHVSCQCFLVGRCSFMCPAHSLIWLFLSLPQEFFVYSRNQTLLGSFPLLFYFSLSAFWNTKLLFWQVPISLLLSSVFWASPQESFTRVMGICSRSLFYKLIFKHLYLGFSAHFNLTFINTQSGRFLT